MNRKGWIIVGVVAVVVILVIAIPCALLLGKDEPKTLRQQAMEALDAVPIIDGHNDLPWQLRKNYMNRLADASIEKGLPSLHTDLPRLRKGKVGAQFWASYVSCKNQYKNAVTLFLEQTDVIRRFAQKYPEDFVFVTTAQGILDAHKNQKIASLVGIEGGHAIDSSLDTLRMLYEMGARYMTLTHGCHTPWHNDLPWQLRKNYMNRLADASIEKGLPSLHTDLPRLRKGKVGAQFWASYVSCKNQYKNAVTLFLEQTDVIRRFAQKYPEDFVFVTTAQGILDAHKNQKIASLVGIEGGHAIDSSLDTLRMLYEMGARYMTLTHGCHTPWADSCSPEQASHNGLTEFGKIVVKEMNRIGMFVDISHVSAKTMHDVLDVTTAPVIFSHSSAYALCNASRNVPDDILKKLPKNGAVVMVNFYNNFVTCKDTATLSDVADHIDHIKKIAGIDHIGMGADYDGVPRVPTGLEDVSKYPDLMEELLKRGYSQDDIKKIAGNNLLRAMKKMEQVAKDSTEKPFDNFIQVNNSCRPPFKKYGS